MQLENIQSKEQYIKTSDYPGIYSEADTLSNKTQRNYLHILKLFLFLLILTSVLSMYFGKNAIVSIINAILSILIVGIAFLLFLYDFQGIWYASRAAAESIKTITWRFITRAEPFTDDNDDSEFINRIEKIVKMNHKFTEHLSATFSAQDCISKEVEKIRNSKLDERIAYYLKYRVEEQRDWYRIKSELNKRNSIIFITLIILLTIILTASLFINIGVNLSIRLPIEILISLITSVFTWVQTKRYRELVSSYGLTSHEIGFILSLSKKIKNETDFSDYVINTENAFSREHTQWLARSDM